VGAVIVGTVAAVVLVVSIGFALVGDSPDSTVSSTLQAPRPTAVTPPERLTPVAYPTRGEYVPPIPTEVPTVTLKPTKTVKPTPKPATSQQRPPCPVQAPFFHDWCIRHGYQPPRGG
jgi:hypothetical protein